MHNSFKFSRVLFLGLMAVAATSSFDSQADAKPNTSVTPMTMAEVAPTPIKPHAILHYNLISNNASSQTNLTGEITANYGETATARYVSLKSGVAKPSPLAKGVNSNQTPMEPGWALGFKAVPAENGDLNVHGLATFSGMVPEANGAGEHLLTVVRSFDTTLHKNAINTVKLPWAGTTLILGVAPQSEFVPDEATRMMLSRGLE